MNNILSYCGLADTRISASEKDLPVQVVCFINPDSFGNLSLLVQFTTCTFKGQHRVIISKTEKFMKQTKILFTPKFLISTGS